MANRFTCEIKCPSCQRCFKSSRTILKHAIAKHGLNLESRHLQFLDSTGATVLPTEPKKISSSRLDVYHSWIGSLTERIGEALHPALPGKWCRIEDAFCPADLFEHLLYELYEQHAHFGPHSVSFVPHRKLPYRLTTVKMSYKIYDIQPMEGVLHQQEEIPLKTSESYCGHTSIKKGGSMEERKAMARSAGLAGFQQSIQQRPTSISKVICKEVEGRATREFELIWWPNLLQKSRYGKFQLRFFVHKTSL